MGLRPVALSAEGTSDRQRVDHVIGVDESGNPTGGEPYVIAAVQCARRNGERLAELLIDCELHPWQAKSQSLAGLTTENEQTERVETFIELLADTPVTWAAAAGWQAYSVPVRSAAACTVASRTLTPGHHGRGAPTIEGDAVLLHDGGFDTYGKHQQRLREQAASKFNASFQSAFCPVYVSSLPKGDLTYPEITAADHIAGYIRNRLKKHDMSVETLPDPVSRIDTSWKDGQLAPLPLYRLQSTQVSGQVQLETRVVSWIQGQRPPKSYELTTEGAYENVVKRIDSPVVQTYLLNLSD